MALRLERRPAELQSYGAAAVHQEIEPAVVSRESEAFQRRASADSHSHQSRTKMRDDAAAYDGRSAVRSTIILIANSRTIL